MLTVSGPASSTALTTLDTFKSELKIQTSADDAWIERQIDIATGWVVGPNGLKVPLADDDTRTCGRETLVQTFLSSDRRWTYRDQCRDELSISRWRGNPSIGSVEEDGTVLQACDYVLTKGGILRRLDGGCPAVWRAHKIVVTYTAGWLLPDDDDRDLPPEIEQGCIELIKIAWYGRQRDPTVRSETNEGVASFTYFFGSPGDGPLPAYVSGMLQNWRY